MLGHLGQAPRGLGASQGLGSDGVLEATSVVCSNSEVVSGAAAC